MNEANGARPVGLPLRLAAMIYEAVLLFGVVFITAYALLAVLQWKYPLTPAQTVVLQAALFVAIGIYFVTSWVRSGQTLPLKSWRLRLVDRSGRPPPLRQAVLRYVLAWTLFVPGLLAVWLLRTHAAFDWLLVVAGFTLMLGPALADPERRLLHDRWSGTRLVREP